MSKTVLISIRSKWCELIASGEKTIEVRKTAPKLETPFKCYIYCTNNGDTLYSVNGKVQPCNSFKINLKENSRVSELNGYVIGEFVCDSIFPLSFYASDASFFDTEPPLPVPGTCLTDKEIVEYIGNGKTGYGWHIFDLVIYDEPKKLSEFMKKPCDFAASCGACNHAKWLSGHRFDGCELTVTRPPQSWCYVEELE